MALTPEEQKELDSILGEISQIDKDVDSLDKIISTDSVSRETTLEPASTTLGKIGQALLPQTAASIQKGIPAKQDITFPEGAVVGGPSGFGALAKPEAAAAPLIPLLEDVGTMTTRVLGAFKGLLTGGSVDEFKQALADPEGGILKGTRKETEKFYDDRIKESDSEIEKNGLRTLKILATTGLGVIEDPSTIASAAGKLFQKGAKTGAKIAGDVKATIATQSEIGQDVLEAASQVPVKDIRRAAGKEGELAEEITQAISPKGEKAFVQPLKTQQKELEAGLVDEGLEGVRIKQPTIEQKGIDPLVGGQVIRDVPDPSVRLIDPKTNEQIDFPLDVLEKVGNDKAFTTQFQSQFDKLRKESEQIIKAVEGKDVISAKDAIQMKEQFQQVLSDKFGVEGKAIFDNVLKSFSASTRAAIEQAAIKAGKPEYVEVMRELSKNRELFKRSRQVLTGKKKGFDDSAAAIAIEKKLNTLMNKFDRAPQQVLEDLDEIFAKSGSPTNFAERGNLSAVARKTGIKEKGTPLTNIIATGKGLALPLLLASSTVTGPLKTVAFITGMVGNSPLAARAAFKSINWAQAAQNSPKIKAMVNSLGKAATADAAIKLMDKIEKEIQKTNPQQTP